MKCQVLVIWEVSQIIILWRLWFVVLLYIYGVFLILSPTDGSVINALNDIGDGDVGNGANTGNVGGVDDVTGSKVEQNTLIT